MTGQDKDTERLVLAGMMSDKDNLDEGLQELWGIMYAISQKWL